MEISKIIMILFSYAILFKLINAVLLHKINWRVLSSSAGKESACNEGDPGSIPGSGRSAWRRDRLPTTVFLGFPGGLASKESTCNAGDLGLIPGLGRSLGEGNCLSTSVFWPGEFHGLYSPWGHKESDMTE